MFKSKILGLVAALSLSLPAVASPTLVTNGGFEGGLTGWTCTGADLCTTGAYFVKSGAAAVYGYDNSGFATLSQTITTTAGSIYDFSFWSATNVLTAGNVIRYQIDGGSIFTVANTLSPAQTQTFFTATGAAATINFFFETDSGTGIIGFDDVVVSDTGRGSAVPEPTSIALIGAALLGLGASSRKRKQKQ